jgi:DNA-binding CsgD family transcriptional regulator
VPQVSPHSRQLIEETLGFLRHALGVRGAMFYWMAPALDTVNDTVIGLPDGLTETYRRDMWSLDPLLAARLARAGKSIAELRQEAKEVPHDNWRRYQSFLSGFDVTGNLDFLFWLGEGEERRAFAGISLVSLTGDPPLSHDVARLTSLYQYIAFNLRSHDHARQVRLQTTLRSIARLTRRESDICELVAEGATNQDVAECLDLTLATVKFYMKQIFDKMGVENRTALAARLAYLQLN